MHLTLLAVGEDWEDQMKPYDQYISNNPKGKWDWYEVGGRFSGFLALKEGSVGTSVDASGKMTESTESGDQARRRDIDGFPPMPHSILVDGKWHDAETVSPHVPFISETSRVAWIVKAFELIKSIDDDDLITIVDCHR